jgi:MORN repeat protein
MSTILSLHDLPKELVDLIAKAIRDLKSWLHLRLTCKQCWTLCSLEQYRVQFLVQAKLANKYYFRLPNGLEHGESKMRYENDQPWTRCFYKDGQLEGEFKMWYRNGQVWEHYFFKENNLEGEYKAWHENGQLFKQCSYKDGQLEGEYETWHENGQLWTHVFYKDGGCINVE